MVKTRFAPSPTGLLHLGNARTALFCALFAHRQKGGFLLRIEDTDQARSKEEYNIELQNDLQWLGLQWDEGPGCDLGHGPYYQSQRQEIYDNHFNRLQAAHLVYPCFCSDAELSLARKTQLNAGMPPRYAGTCAHLTAAEIEEKKAKGIPFTWRFRVPTDEIVVFNDLVREEQRFATNDIGDFIIRRADGSFPFLFSNALDDALMDVTHVLRGEDHVANTPRQLLLMKALSLPTPEYGHMPLIVSDDNTPLSKREGSWSVADLRASGYLPGAINNYLARLGHYYAENNYFSLPELAERFELSSLGRSPARFDVSQLHYWQKMALQNTTLDEIWHWMGMVVQVLVPITKRDKFIETILPNVIFPADVVDWAQHMFSPTELHLGEAEKNIIKETDELFFETGLGVMEDCDWTHEQLLKALKEKANAQGKKLFQPLRITLTGQLHGPELPALIELMGNDQVQHRFKQALTLTKQK